MQQLSAGTSSRQHERRANVPERRAKARGRDPVDLLMGVLDEIDYGLILVDESARVRFANQVALNECACGLVVRVQEGVFTPRDAGDQKALQKALWAARRGCRSLLRLSGGGATHTVAVVPLDPSSGLATLLVFGKRQICEPLSLDFFARTHQLSLAESTVLRRLCDGSLPEQIAQENGVAISTIRTQISSVRSKTGTRSISELIGRLTTLPPMVSTLRRQGMFATPATDRVAA
ncbi:MAG: helix-turn-helix transcriptional regulator [Rhodoferax sp.]|nr:helix-turn-helix transcriptional regulator [Rhodoferax sp.]